MALIMISSFSMLSVKNNDLLMPVLGSWVKNETGSIIIYWGSGMVKTLARHFMFIVAQRVGVTVHKRTNVSFTNTKLLGVSEEVVWIFFDSCYCSILLKMFLIKVTIT